MVTASRSLVMAIKKEYNKRTLGSDLDNTLLSNSKGAGKRNRTTELFEMVVLGQDEGSRNDTLVICRRLLEQVSTELYTAASRNSQ